MPVLLFMFAYACGSIPTGVLLARSAGIDPQQAGSGNIGAANVARTAGLGLGLLTLVGDAAKGTLPVLLALWLFPEPSVHAATALGAFLGHLFPVSLRFVGGKGVATALGALIVLCPLATTAAIVAFTVTLLLTRFVSLASLLAAGVIPLAVAGFGYPGPYLAASTVMALLVLVRHRDNVRRLRAGTEHRFELHKR